ncbi:phage protease [Geminisphaera colitermitum]|uniref:phage protease n=1 Tax=Geminisphaera colitermitum TaxID=1148786 RepID=UPI000158D3F3|nr:phage protease [Geminisphaera colitermitum]
MFIRSVRCHYSTLPLEKEGGLPARILIGKWGRNKSVVEDYTIDATTLKLLPQNQTRAGFDTVSLDFEHNTVPGTPEYKAGQEPRKIAATGTLEIIEGEGIYFHAINWTPEGREAVLGKHYPDLSPVVVTNKDGKVVLIHSIALCRQGATEGLRLSLHSVGIGDEKLSDPNGSANSNQSANANTNTMKPEDIAKLFLQLAGLDETATAEQIQGAHASLQKQITDAKTATSANADEKAKADASAAEKAKADAAAAAAKTDSTAQTLQAHSIAIETLTKQLENTERANITAAAIRDGKLIPQSAQKLTLDQFRTLVSELPANVVPLQQRTPEGIKAHSISVPTAADLVGEDVRRQLGISKEDWAKQ